MPLEVSNKPTVSTRFRQGCKSALARVLYHGGLSGSIRHLARTHELSSAAGAKFPRLRRASVSKFGILCYHRVGTEGVPLFSRLAPALFEAQMRHLRKHYRIVSLEQLCLELREGRSVRPTLAVTFDDGYRDLYTYAFPVLKQYEIPATIYLIGRCMQTGEVPWYDRIFAIVQAAPGPSLELGMDGARTFEILSTAARAQAAWEIVSYLRTIPDTQRRDWSSEFERRFKAPEAELHNRMLTWDQVRTMQRNGMNFGAHTMTHPSVGRLKPDQLEEELSRSRQVLESGLQSSVLDFAYPFGKVADCSSEAEAFLRANGYQSAATTVEGLNGAGSDLFSLNRIQIGDRLSMAMFSFEMARAFLAGSVPDARNFAHGKGVSIARERVAEQGEKCATSSS